MPLSLNPLIVKSWRERCRPRYLLSWGMVVLTITLFVTTVVYWAQVDNGSDPQLAARWTLVPILVIQAVLLIFFGTGAVAGAVSAEREERLLDYQRMTPMSPTAKIVGYLFGLPIREYALTALTLPFLVWPIWRGGFPVGVLLHFYFVLLLSVTLYHMTGMVAGMVSNRPRWAAYIAQSLVIALYFVLPLLSFLGFTAFEFLTIRPVLLGLIVEQIGGPERIPTSGAALLATASLNKLDAFRPIPFFMIDLHPTIYTVLVQSSLLSAMYFIVRRNWLSEASHNFSKRMAMLVTLGVALFALGSIWPILHDRLRLGAFLDTIDAGNTAEGPPIGLFAIVSILTLTLILFAGFSLTQCIPTGHQARQAWRLARRNGRRRPGWNWDGASASITVWICAAIAAATVTTVGVLASRSGIFFIEPPPIQIAVLPIVGLVAILLFSQAIQERYGKRGSFVIGFIVWIIPAMVAVILLIPDLYTAAAYVALLCPPGFIVASVWNAVINATYATEFAAQLPEIRSTLPFRLETLAFVGAGMHVSLAALAQVNLAQWKRRLRTEAIGPETALTVVRSVPAEPA